MVESCGEALDDLLHGKFEGKPLYQAWNQRLSKTERERMLTRSHNRLWNAHLFFGTPFTEDKNALMQLMSSGLNQEEDRTSLREGLAVIEELERYFLVGSRKEKRATLTEKLLSRSNREEWKEVNQQATTFLACDPKAYEFVKDPGRILKDAGQLTIADLCRPEQMS